MGKMKAHHSCMSDVAIPEGVEVTISLLTTVTDTIACTLAGMVVMAT